MEPLNGLGTLSEWVRQKLSESATRPAKKDAVLNTRVPVHTRGSATAELERHLRSKLRELGPAAAQSVAARRSIIASLLICELDERLHNESKFNGLVAEIQQAIDGDAGLKKKFDALIIQLSRLPEKS
jgi:hypothetical protein